MGLHNVCPIVYIYLILIHSIVESLREGMKNACGFKNVFVCVYAVSEDTTSYPVTFLYVFISRQLNIFVQHDCHLLFETCTEWCPARVF